METTKTTLRIHEDCLDILSPYDSEDFVLVGIQDAPDPEIKEGDNFRKHFCIVTNFGQLEREEPTAENLCKALANMLGYKLVKDRLPSGEHRPDHRTKTKV